MKLPIAPYVDQDRSWPAEGRHILAHHDAETVIVYQAYRPSIGEFAVKHGYFGGPDFSLSRMSWIKPNFMWMMYRCGWGTKAGQEVVLALRLRRKFFDSLLAAAVPSSYDESRYSTRAEWQQAVEDSDVRRQWDPDHSPTGARLQRRAIQLGLRMRRFARDELLEVIDMTSFVQSQGAHAHDGDAQLMMPLERVYVPV